jgi:hypothetical protein
MEMTSKNPAAYHQELDEFEPATLAEKPTDSEADIMIQLNTLRSSFHSETTLKLTTRPCIYGCHKIIVAER